MTWFYVICILFMFYVVSIIWSGISSKKKYKQIITSRFGVKPKEREYDFYGISSYWNEIKGSLPEKEQVDDITWNDLDMDKVFARINKSSSSVGEEYLYATLRRVDTPNDKLKVLEEKIQYMKEHPEERLEIQYVLSRIGKNERNLLPIFLKNIDMFEIKHIWLYRLLQILLGIVLLSAMVFQSLEIYGALIIVVVANTFVYFRNKFKYELHLETLNYITSIVKASEKLTKGKNFHYKETFPELEAKSKSFRRGAKSIISFQNKQTIKQSFGSAEAMVIDYIIGLTMMNFIVYQKAIKELKEKLNSFLSIYECIGQIELVISILSFRESSPHYVLPEFCEKNTFLMENMYHPLIDDPKTNTVSIDKNSIISGSNASGKSTFIKAIAINAILAQNIHTCMAIKFCLPRANVITSMAVRDNLESGESYYIAEIKYLNRIIKMLDENLPVLCFIDEILRGTNTQERIAASSAILKYLEKKNCLCMVATHDLELTKIFDGVCDNYNFREEIRDSEIYFDYQIRTGSATTKNAIKLLEYIGFPKQIIDEANNYCKELV